MRACEQWPHNKPNSVPPTKERGTRKQVRLNGEVMPSAENETEPEAPTTAPPEPAPTDSTWLEMDQIRSEMPGTRTRRARFDVDEQD